MTTAHGAVRRVTARGILVSLRLARFELLFVGAVLLAGALAAVLAAGYIESLAPPLVCFEPYDYEPLAGCEAAGQAYYEAQGRFASPLTLLLVGGSLVAGGLIGVTIVAREIERGTARLAWSLSPSRVRWYLSRLLPILGLFAAITFVAGFGADRLSAASLPGRDTSNAFDAFGMRGVLVAARAVFVLSIAVAIGSLMGRVLPAILVTAVIATFGLAGGTGIHQRILQGEAVAIEGFNYNSGALYMDQRFRLPDGSLVGYDYFDGGSPYDENGFSIFPEVVMGVPGERYREVELREMGALAGASLGFLLLGLVVTNRRRPE